MFFALFEISILLSLLLAFSDFSPILRYNTITGRKTQAFEVANDAETAAFKSVGFYIPKKRHGRRKENLCGDRTPITIF